jgi:hypothetical protein
MAMVVITSVFKIFEKTMAFMDFLYTLDIIYLACHILIRT